MPLTFEGIENGASKFRDLDTGEKLFSEDTLDNALNTFGETTEDKDLITSKLGETFFEDANAAAGALKDSNPYDASNNLEGRSYTVDNAGTKNQQTLSPGSAPRSQFNAWTLFKYKTLALGNENDDINAPDLKQAINAGKEASLNNPTAKKIVEECSKIGGEKKSFGHNYQLKDFIQCEHYGTIPNNYMITLRRFPFPAPDDIFSPKQFGPDGKPVPTEQPDIARAITWMSPSLGNELKNIFSFSTGYNWKDVEAQVQEVQGRTDRGKVGNRISGSPLLTAIEAGANGYDAVSAARKREHGAGYDPMSNTYPNHVYGPLNVIKSMMIRDRGINFDKEFTLNFYYDLKAYGNVSPRAAFMDTLANLLVLTSNNAPFWGGATRGVSNGMAGKPFGDLAKLQSGDYSGFLGGIVDQFADMGKNIWNDVKSGNSKVLNNIIGGGLMELFGSKQGATVLQAFLTGDPTGQWHITVGNPLNPAMVIGNLGLQSANFEFDGPLGYEDFPTKLKLTVTLKPGRPRDKTEIESMFNSGKSRLYVQPEGGPDIALYNQGAYGNKTFGAGMETNGSDMAFG